MNKTEKYLAALMRDVCEELGLPEEKQERAPILEALNDAYNRGAADSTEAKAKAKAYDELVSLLAFHAKRGTFDVDVRSDALKAMAVRMGWPGIDGGEDGGK